MAQNNSTLYLLSYNNYYNRIVKREATINDYLTYSSYQPLVCNFNPADGIDTEHIFNVPYVANTPVADYVVAVDENNDITSRWFIVNATRTRGGQYRLSLHRDLLADYYDAVLSAPCYIERAIVPTSSPFIFNSENMNFNQIKKKEILLKDKSATPWIVGYISNDYYKTPLVSPDTDDGYGYIYAETDQERQPTYSASWLELKALGRVVTGATTSNQTVKYTCAFPSGYAWVFTHGKNGIGATPPPAGTDYNTNWYCSGTTDTLISFKDAFVEKATRDPYFIGLSLLKDYITGYKTSVATLKTYSGQALYNTDYVEGQETTNGPKYFYFDMVQLAQNTETVRPAVNSRVYNEMKNYITNIYSTISSRFYFNEDTSKTGTFEVEFPCEVYSCSVSTVPSLLKVRTDIYGSVDGSILPKQQLYDAPYTMFATPYKDCIIDLEGGGTIDHNGMAARNICSQISKILGGSGETSYIYDLQLLPYCPVPQLLEDAETGHLNLQRWTRVSANHSLIKTGNDYSLTQGMIFWLSGSSFKSYVDLENPIVMPSDAIEAKVDIETKMCRLVSPNYSGAFEFNPLKNGGVSSFEINATYKPFQPLIHINPLFNTGFLYGGDFDDNRGLICGGDFSLPQTSDAWISYQTQNRSYREAFDRQIQNMETTYDINREQMKTAGIVSAVTAGVSGATTGAMAGSLVPGVGTIAGVAAGAALGVASGVASGVGLAADLKAADALQKEALSYAGDQFGYSLQNIQALPTTMSRVSAFDINNKYFPFVEFYEATPEEEQALRNKITYNSMSVMAIGSIGQYKQTDRTFIQGQVIRLENLGEDYHSAAAIAAEIQKGVYI